MKLPHIESIPVNIYNSILSNCTQALGLEQSLSIFFEEIQKSIPATHIICSWVDQNLNVWIPLVELHIHGGSLAQGKWLQIPQTTSFEFEDIVLVNDISSVPEISLFSSISLPARRSILSIVLQRNEGSFIALALGSEDINVFTKEHAHFLALFKEPLAKIIEKYFISMPNRTLQLLSKNFATNDILGFLHQCKGLETVMKRVNLAAKIQQLVLINGETGTGKELVARAIHNLSERKDGPFIPVNCGAIPENLLESMLFGHEKGAFTGASSIYMGYFEQASGGTLFLDEIGELSLSAQARFLRVLEEREVTRLGGKARIPVNARILAATNRNLKKMIEKGTFREDLFYRINVINIEILPLRERREDIPLIANYFIDQFATDIGFKKVPVITPKNLDLLSKLELKGNVRELRNIIEQALFLAKLEKKDFLIFDSIFAQTDYSYTEDQTNLEINEKMSLNELNSKHILEALKTTNGIIDGPKGAAILLGIKGNTLRARMKKIGITYKTKS